MAHWEYKERRKKIQNVGGSGKATYISTELMLATKKKLGKI